MPEILPEDGCWAEFRRQMPITNRWAYFDHAAVSPLPAPTGGVIRQWCESASVHGDVAWPEWAAGVETVISVKALKEGVIPPTINLANPDPDLDLDFVPNQAREKKMSHVMCNAFAFGGHNGALLFSKI